MMLKQCLCAKFMQPSPIFRIFFEVFKNTAFCVKRGGWLFCCSAAFLRQTLGPFRPRPPHLHRSLLRIRLGQEFFYFFRRIALEIPDAHGNERDRGRSWNHDPFPGEKPAPVSCWDGLLSYRVFFSDLPFKHLPGLLLAEFWRRGAQLVQESLFFRADLVRKIFYVFLQQRSASLASGGMRLELGGLWIRVEACSQVAKIVFAGTVRSGYLVHLRIRKQPGALEVEHAAAAGRTVVEVLLHPRFCLRSRTGGSLPILLNLSIAQMLSLLIHCTLSPNDERRIGFSSFQ